MFFDIMEIWFGIDNGQISSIFYRALPATQQWRGIMVSQFYLYRTVFNCIKFIID